MKERPPREATPTMAFLAVAVLFVVGIVIGFVLGRTV